jgi:hypothetical protein
MPREVFGLGPLWKREKGAIEVQSGDRESSATSWLELFSVASLVGQPHPPNLPFFEEYKSYLNLSVKLCLGSAQNPNTLDLKKGRGRNNCFICLERRTKGIGKVNNEAEP